MRKNKIGPKIKKLRKTKSLTQKQLADALGYSDKSMITHIEKGDSDMTYEKILLLLRTYSLDANELFEVENIDKLLEDNKKYRVEQEKSGMLNVLRKCFERDDINYVNSIKRFEHSKGLSKDDIYFKPLVNQEDLIHYLFDYDLTDEQKDLVNPPSFSIGRAYLNPNHDFPFVICLNDETRIGFITLSRWRGKGDAFSWSYFIEQKFQGNGYGKKAAELAIDVFRAINKDKKIKLATEKDNKKAQKLYKSLGFKKLSELDGDDLVFGL